MLVVIGCLIVFQANAQQVLPDSIYTYLGKNKMLSSGAVIRYDENGRKVLEEGVRNRNSDEVLDENDQAYKIEYVYTQTGDRICVEEFHSELKGEKWACLTKRVQFYTISNPHIPVELYDYTASGENWALFANTIGTEFDEKKLPVVLMDSFFYASVAYEITRMEVTYNDDNWPETIVELTKNENSDAWIPFRKRQNVYNEQKKEVKNLFYYPDDDGSWIFLYEFLYTYDEKGNATSMIRVEEGKNTYETYYRNVYLSGDDANDVLPDGTAPHAEISLTDGRLCVKWADEVPFDVAIYNMSGMLMMQQTGNRNEAVVPVSRLVEGVYVVKVTSGTFIYTQKVVK